MIPEMRLNPGVDGAHALTLDAYMPSQYNDARRCHELPPIKRLQLAILQQAIEDLSHQNLAIVKDSMEWMSSHTGVSGFTFVDVCESLGISWSKLRAELLKPKVLPLRLAKLRLRISARNRFRER